ncbi:MAG: PH domain-containing protein [Acidimicrobiales bacterium]
MALALATSIRYAVDSVHGLDRYQGLLYVIVVGPVLVLVATRAWRWRSNKIHVTSQRLVVEYGAIKRVRTSVELRDVVLVHTQQGLGGRLAARGDVVVETVAGPWLVGTIRHPAALVRLIEAERSRRPESPWGYDDVVEPPFPWQSTDAPGYGWERA